jgi:hypothetical protein
MYNYMILQHYWLADKEKLKLFIQTTLRQTRSYVKDFSAFFSFLKTSLNYNLKGGNFTNNQSINSIKANVKVIIQISILHLYVLCRR